MPLFGSTLTDGTNRSGCVFKRGPGDLAARTPIIASSTPKWSISCSTTDDGVVVP